MWLFLGSEVLLFSGLFVLYAAYRVTYGLDFVRAAQQNDALLGATNTVVLITSSLTVALSLHAARIGKTRTVRLLLVLSCLLGLLFLGNKAIEYRHHFAQGIYPGRHARVSSPGERLFFTLYYLMTGLHGMHVLAGMLILGTLAIYAQSQTPEHHITLELGGLYWHLVDVIWIFLWPLLYLVR